MFRSRLAAATVSAVLAAGAVVGIAPLALAAPATAASPCVNDLLAAQASNNDAITADQVGDTMTARTHNLSTTTSLGAAMNDCFGQPQIVGANILTASGHNAGALLSNLVGASSAALSSELAAASAIDQALANAS
ncbi:hypothetical protein [Streptomyces sp. HUAS TT20]|uniref:hypothetical protein n=1 Tax=Streptomyces sp. HUAS TT20 TaxID=3447509 RepID=UPI0021D98B62|nr:hypothetical protein [Streptomyces sp. HUAS 15-9]UXY31904.1 hypothetical protein N8I87_38740 [Streptomyces sp. HUAS 15-9]